MIKPIRPWLLLGLACAVLLATRASPCAAFEVLEVAQPDADAMEQQLRAQFEPIVKVELSFISRAAKLNDEDRQKLIAAASEWLDKFVGDWKQKGGNRRGIRVLGGGVRTAANPRDSAQEGIATVAKSVLSPDQMALYEQERQKREEFRKSTAVAGLLVRLDDKLALSTEQRDKLATSLTADWDANWAPSLEMFMFRNDMWPNVPNDLVKSHLTPAQFEVWSRLNKQPNHVFWGAHFGNDGQVIDDIELHKPQEQKK